jgi:hypothetical protein
MPRAEAVDLRALLLLATMNVDDEDDDDDDNDDGSSIKVVRACLVVGVAFVERGENEVTSDGLLLHIAAARAAAVENLMLVYE